MLKSIRLFILLLGLILSLIGLFLSIYANSILYSIIHTEKELKINGNNVTNEEIMILEQNLQKMFDKKIEASKYGYIGIIIMAIGFIISNIFNIIYIEMYT